MGITEKNCQEKSILARLKKWFTKIISKNQNVETTETVEAEVLITAQEISRRALPKETDLDKFKKLFHQKTKEMYKKRKREHIIIPQEWEFSEKETRAMGAVEYAESLGFKLRWSRLSGDWDIYFNNIINIVAPDK